MADRRKLLPAAIALAGIEVLRPAVRRTSVQRGAVLLGAFGLLVFAAVSATTRSVQLPSARSESRSGVIVLDMSRSISPSRMTEIRTLLDHFAVPSRRVGLVFFSDTAYELLPPGSPGTELRPFIRYFTPYPKGPHSKKLVLPSTPWDESFRGGTQISTGLEAARQAMLRHGTRGEPILLASDLNTYSNDLPNVTREILTLRKEQIPLRIVPLEPTIANRDLFMRLAGASAFLPVSSLGAASPAHAVESTFRSAVSGGVAAAAVMLLIVLAIGELWCGRLVLRPEGSP